ncbi:GntR family transcriptional regulator [Pantoea latae]|uniref:GntR family transcriptional regulator n=1 Tax=Pantoea latae TaxID=1964541 RepID=A0A1V9DHR4_9GAMM|nr:GntR family transcriptional regulator [Pantoea latae]OQP33315.1 GntR family transcriptional regulator [Pantoea latae]
MAGKPATLRRKSSASSAPENAGDARWQARPRTLVDHAVDAILSAASRGLILPGDRIVEPDLVTRLGMSRVPIREALRILESQGIVTSEPYKGIRLMEISHQRLEQIIDVRVPLETLACRRAIEAGRNGAGQLTRLYQGVAQMQCMMQSDDVYGFASADTDFHRTLCSFAHNPVLSNLWESIARQLTVIFGLSTLGKSMSDIIEEHQRLINVFAEGDIAQMTDEIENHIRIQALDVDYETLITQRRQQRSAED